MPCVLESPERLDWFSCSKLVFITSLITLLLGWDFCAELCDAQLALRRVPEPDHLEKTRILSPSCFFCFGVLTSIKKC